MWGWGALNLPYWLETSDHLLYHPKQKKMEEVFPVRYAAMIKPLPMHVEIIVGWCDWERTAFTVYSLKKSAPSPTCMMCSVGPGGRSHLQHTLMPVLVNVPSTRPPPPPTPTQLPADSVHYCSVILCSSHLIQCEDQHGYQPPPVLQSGVSPCCGWSVWHTVGCGGMTDCSCVHHQHKTCGFNRNIYIWGYVQSMN